MPQFDISSFSSQIFWLVSIIGGLYLFVHYFIAPNAESILIVRKQLINENIIHAEKCNIVAKKLYSEKQERIAEVNSKVEDVHQRAMDLIEDYFIKQKQALSITIDIKNKESLSEIEDYINQFHKDELNASIRLASYIIKIITNKPANVKLITEIYSRVQ